MQRVFGINSYNKTLIKRNIAHSSTISEAGDGWLLNQTFSLLLENTTGSHFPPSLTVGWKGSSMSKSPILRHSHYNNSGSWIILRNKSLTYPHWAVMWERNKPSLWWTLALFITSISLLYEIHKYEICLAFKPKIHKSPTLYVVHTWFRIFLW